MRLLVYLAILCVCEAFAVTMAMALDYHGKLVDYKKVVRKKINCVFIKSNYEKKHFLPIESRPVSKKSFVYQCINIAYVLVYVIIAIIETFIYNSILIMCVNLIIVGIYGVINLFVSLWLGVSSEKSM